MRNRKVRLTRIDCYYYYVLQTLRICYCARQVSHAGQGTCTADKHCSTEQQLFPKPVQLSNQYQAQGWLSTGPSLCHEARSVQLTVNMHNTDQLQDMGKPPDLPHTQRCQCLGVLRHNNSGGKHI
jgi:hypothetical protein